MYKSFNKLDEKKPNEAGKPNVVDVKPVDSNNEKPPLEVGNIFCHSIGRGGGGGEFVLRQKNISELASQMPIIFVFKLFGMIIARF